MSQTEEEAYEHHYGYSTVYDIASLYTSGCEGELEYIAESGGVCSGMSLEWLRRVVGKNEDPEYSLPDVVYSRVLQVHVEENDVWLHDFPRMVGLVNKDRRDFFDLSSGLAFVYNNPGTYFLAYITETEGEGHAYGFISRKHSPDYLLDPSYACYRIYSNEALGDRFRHHPYVRDWEAKGYKLIVIRVEQGADTEVTDTDDDRSSEEGENERDNSDRSNHGEDDCKIESGEDTDEVITVSTSDDDDVNEERNNIRRCCDCCWYHL